MASKKTIDALKKAKAQKKVEAPVKPKLKAPQKIEAPVAVPEIVTAPFVYEVDPAPLPTYRRYKLLFGKVIENPDGEYVKFADVK